MADTVHRSDADAPVGVLLAAGEGRRMGTPKALVHDRAGESWLVRSATALRAGGCRDVVVVLGCAHERAAALLTGKDFTIVVAQDWRDGMSASLCAGLRAARATTASRAVVTLVDLPDVGAGVVARVIGNSDGASGLSRAAYHGRPGHPVVLGRDHWAGVTARATGDQGARDYLAEHHVELVECSDLAGGQDIDRPGNLTRRGAMGDDRGMDSAISSAQELAGLLDTTGYLADDALATVGFLALRLHRPLLLEGEPGTGKTSLAEAFADGLHIPLIRLQCYEGIDATQALYDWDFPRQILHLRAVETAQAGSDNAEKLEEIEKSLFDERFLLARPVLRALRESPAVLLIDEIDRADDEFEAFLLEVLSTYQVTIPELGTICASPPPVVVLTSNRTRELHDALKRRCLYHWIDHPGLERELAIVRRRAPEVSESLAAQVVQVVQQLRIQGDLRKPPGVAETLDWARALHALGTADLDIERASATLGAAIKYREDADRVRASLDRILAS